MNIFKTFETNAVIKGQQYNSNYGMWTEGTVGQLTTFYSGNFEASVSGVSTVSTSIKRYYYDVWSTPDSSSLTEFSVAYGHIYNSGSLQNGGTVDYAYPTKAVWSSINNLLSPGGVNDPLKNDAGNTLNHFYAIAVRRGNIKEWMDPGNWQLTISSSLIPAITLIDSSHYEQNSTIYDIVPSSKYLIVSGTIAAGAYPSSASPTVYGHFFPYYGVLVIDPDKFSTGLGLDTGSNAYKDNAGKFFRAIKGGANFIARSSENIKSQNFFCRVDNDKFNYSTNKTFQNTNGRILIPQFINNPQVYITTVGLYNDAGELLAVAKLSRPVKKNFQTELNINVRLNY